MKDKRKIKDPPPSRKTPRDQKAPVKEPPSRKDDKTIEEGPMPGEEALP